MTDDEMRDIGHRLMDWFETQGLRPSDAAKVMAVTFSSMSYGQHQKDIMDAFNEMVEDWWDVIRQGNG